jgi:hypothetical protein
MLTLFLVIIPKPALCDTNMLDVFGWRNTSLREISIELDPRKLIASARRLIGE